MNKVVLMGKLTREIELNTTRSGVAFCRFTLAVRRSRPNPDGTHDTDFFTCTAWRGLAINMSKYVHKGDKICVSGEILLNKFTDKQGIERISADIDVQDADFGGKFVANPNPESESPVDIAEETVIDSDEVY